MVSPCAFLVLCLATLQTAFGETDPDYVKKVMDIGKDCLGKYPIPKETLTDVLTMKKEDLTDDDKCFIGCVFETIGIIKDNSYNPDLHKAMSPKKYSDPSDIEKANQVVDICKSQVKSSELCQLGYELSTCVSTESKKIGLKPLDPKK